MNPHLERLDGVAPLLHAPVRRLLELSELKLHRKLMIVTGYRSLEEQLLKYSQGRTVNRETGDWEVTNAKEVVTNATPGRSAHNVVTRAGRPASLAVDLCPVTPSGVLDWTPGAAFWEALWELAHECGLDPLGDRIGAYLKGDDGHFEEPAWKLKMEALGLTLPSLGIKTA